MSGTLTRDQLVTEICDTVGKSVSASSVSSTTLQTRVQTYYLNWAQRRIARAYDFYELDDKKTNAATVAEVKTYPLETGTNNLGLTRIKDIQSLILVDGTNTERSRKLERIHYRRFDKRYPRPENYSSNIPSLYVRQGNNIELFRIPDAVYTLVIRYSKWPTPFTTGSQVSDFDDKDELIITAGVLETYLALEEYADAAVWTQRFIGKMKDEVESEADTDWEPQAEFFETRRMPPPSSPWLTPSGYAGDPLYGYED